MNRQETKRDAQRTRSNREELVERIERELPEDGLLEAFPGFLLARSSKPTGSLNDVYQPAFCFVAQGAKQVLLGEELFRYDPLNYMLFTVDLPLTFQVVEASEERPYLGFRLDLDPTLVASVMMESGVRFEKGDVSAKAMDVKIGRASCRERV